MSSAPRPLSDSPFFWAYLFATAALIALALIGPKFAARQAQIEREFQGRQRATEKAHHQESTVKMSTAERTLVTLQPLFLVFAAVMIAAWLVFWQSRVKRYGRSTNPSLPMKP